MRPELNEIKKDFIKRGLLDDTLVEVYPGRLARIKYLSEQFDKRFNGKQGLPGKNGKQGPTGNKGRDGIKPVQGIDYLTEKEIKHVKERLIREIELLPPTVIDKTVTKEVKIEVPPERIIDLILETIQKIDFTMTAKQIRGSLETLKGEDRLDAKHIKNLPKTRMIGGGAGSSNAGGATLFTNLTDVPNSYAGQAGKTVTVKGTEDGLEFSTPAGGGDMLKATYDPQNIEDDAFDRANHTGVQGTDTISGLNELILAYAIVL